ncbi:MAG: substrate-binding domain-containing protein [Deltaproteobacteria bacterium]|nr:substrate-binding domain-containing protein [Deltaproteobacteria bacterium]
MVVHPPSLLQRNLQPAQVDRCFQADLTAAQHQDDALGVLQLRNFTSTNDRNAGFREGIKGAPVDVVFDADMKWLEPAARKEMESALAVNPALDVVYAHNDPGAHGAYLAAKAAGREKKMLFVGIDGLPQEGRMYVKQGILEASFEYPTGGREAVEGALSVLSGKTLPKEITLRSHVFTKANVDKGGEWL